MLTELETERLLETIAELGGKTIKEDDIAYEGTRLIVPVDWRGDLGKAIDFLRKKIKEDDEEAVFVRRYNYRPFDGAICAFRAMRKAFGMVHGQATYSFFGKRPPAYIQVAVSPTEKEEVPWGQFTVPLLEGAEFNFGHGEHQEYGEVFEINVTSPRKYRFIIEGLFKLIGDELASGSIYRGQAIDGQELPEFLELSTLDASKIVYSEQVQADLEANIWAVLRYSEQHKALGLPLKRAILLLGAYGTGKSLAGYLTAREAVAHAWTFIMARPGRDDFLQVMQTARLYQPAVVFFEDAESVTGTQSTEIISQVLDVFDGITAKSTNLMVVMTTNHPELIHKGMHRPGRVDAQIEIGSLDGPGVEKLIRVLVRESMLAEDVDFGAVIEACRDYVPAFVKEVTDRAVRYALARNKGRMTYQISTEDLVHAANGLRPQFLRMTGASEEADREPPLSKLVQRAATTAIADLAAEKPNASVWNQKALTGARKNGS